MTRVSLCCGALAAVLLLVPAWSLAEDENSLPVLRRNLMYAQGDKRIGKALDRLTALIGQSTGGFKDHSAFGDWLSELPNGRNKHPKVLQRIGWAYVTARRGPEAVKSLEAALKDDPGSGLTRAYLGEALRQAGRYTEAIEMLATALRARYDKQHVKDSAVEAAVALRRPEALRTGEGLPAYASAMAAFLAAKPDAALEATLASWLLADLDAYEKPKSDRGRLWARAASKHAHAALRRAGATVPGAAELALKAAEAVTYEDRGEEGRTERFDLLVLACRLGQPSHTQPHATPKAFTLLAEAALREGRFELAYRMARKRLEISYAAAAVRVLRKLPPDLGME